MENIEQIWENILAFFTLELSPLSIDFFVQISCFIPLISNYSINPIVIHRNE